MDPELILFWALLSLAAGSVVQQRTLGWQWVGAAIIVAGLLTQATVPAAAPYVLFGLWFVLILIPTVFAHATNRAVLAQRFERAYWLNAVVSVLHPLDHWPEQGPLFRGLALVAKGRWDLAEPILRKVAEHARQPAIGLSALTRLCARTADWQPVLDDPRLLSADPPVVVFRFHALGETGQTYAMLELAERLETTPWPAPQRMLWALCQMRILGFGGRPDGVATLFRTTLRHVPAETAACWVATAQIAAGGALAEIGGATMRGLADTATPEIRQMATKRLVYTPAAPATEAAQNQLDRMEASLTAQATAGRIQKSPPAMAGLAAVIVFVFLIEAISGGVDDGDVLYHLGGLWPRAVLIDGEWWRLATALFLHAGPIHLIFNLLALLVLGLRFEPMIGSWRFVTIYFVSGLLSMVGILVAMHLDWIESGLTVGASGALMGLAGAAAGGFVRRRWGVWSVGLVQRLLVGVALVALQAAIDLSTPHVSFMGHAGGLLVGFALGLMPWVWTKDPKASTAAAPVDALSRRQMVSYGFAAVAFAVALLIRSRDQRGQVLAKSRQPFIMTDQILSGLRRLRLERAANGGYVSISRRDPFLPALALDDLSPSGALYWQIMAAIPPFCAHARLAPGRYILHPAVAALLGETGMDRRIGLAANGGFQFTDDHARLIRAMAWDIGLPGDAGVEGNRPTRPTVTRQDAALPYGGTRQYLPYAVADTLGYWADRAAGADFIRRMFEFQLQLYAALPISFQYASWPEPLGTKA